MDYLEYNIHFNFQETASSNHFRFLYKNFNHVKNIYIIILKINFKSNIYHHNYLY